jgi:hypothetical protein
MLVPRLRKEAGSSREANRCNRGRGLAVTVELEMGGESISEHVVLLGALLGDQGLQRAPKQLLVALGPGEDAINEQASQAHGGDKAGVARACGGAPRRVAAS